jgi:hypothetical protein
METNRNFFAYSILSVHTTGLEAKKMIKEITYRIGYGQHYPRGNNGSEIKERITGDHMQWLDETERAIKDRISVISVKPVMKGIKYDCRTKETE